MKPGETQFFRFWPRSKPVPNGWEVLPALDGCHHGFHAVLIRQKEALCERK